MGRAERITREVQTYDRELYCDKNMEGMLCIYRKGRRYESYQLEDGSVLTYARPSPHFVFALSDTWRATGKPVEWGVVPILNRLKALDLWNRDLVGELEAAYDKDEESNARKRRNDTESFLLDFRSQFKKTFNDTRVANMDMKKDKRRIKRIKE
jgi:hypothetical protein